MAGISSNLTSSDLVKEHKVDFDELLIYHSILHMAARFFLSYLCAVSLISCKDLTNPPGADTPSLYSPPDTIPLDLEQGYKINLLSGDSIKHIYNYFTDTIKSGVPIPLKGKIISTDTITPSRTFYLDVERKFTLPSNVSLIPPVDNCILSKRLLVIPE